MDFSYHSLIEAKKAGRALSRDQFFAFARAVADCSWPDYQIAAFLMAIRLKGMNRAETSYLTQAMAHYSEKLSTSEMAGFTVDKHSTGGVGDGISLVLAPLAAALGLSVPMMSGRSLGLTMGTLDKLEAIPGFRVQLSRQTIARQVKQIGLAMFGQTKDMAPVDLKLYSLRDAIGAVDSIPLIVASIVSKKLTEGLKGLVFDVKVGRGAFCQSRKQAQFLAAELTRVACASGLRAGAVLSRMEEPLGRAVGDALEIEQAWNILSGSTESPDYLEVTFELLFHMLRMAGRVKNRAECRAMALEAIANGKALSKFQALLLAQGVSRQAALDLPRYLPRPRKIWEIRSPQNGWVAFVDARQIALSTLHLGCLRKTITDVVDHAAGILFFKKSGEPVRKGEPLARLQAVRASEQECKIAESFLLKAYRFAKQKPKYVAPVLLS